MLKSLLGTAILIFSIPTAGMLAAGLVCILMGFANIPGYKTWRQGAASQSKLTTISGVLLGWIGQSLILVLFATALTQFAYWFFGNFEFWTLFRWMFFAGLFFLCLYPIYKTLQAAEFTSPAEERPYYRRTLSLTGVTTAVFFVVLAIWLPRL